MFFDLVHAIDWKQYVSDGQAVNVEVTTKNSILSSTRTLQSLTNKAIYKKLLWNSDKKRDTNPHHESLEVMIWIENDLAQIFVNTSGTWLYQRWYRKKTWDAPIKENLAAGLVLMSWWKFNKPFIDPFCGSWTILIEAAMIAKNIAPGLNRHFAFQKFKDYKAKDFEKIISDAKAKIFTKKEYHLFGMDKDPELVEIAKANAKAAHVDQLIEFKTQDFLKWKLGQDREHDSCNFVIDELGLLKDKKDFWIVSNPPYGKRISPDDLYVIYKALVNLFEHSPCVRGGFISSFTQLMDMVRTALWTEKKLFNGAEPCSFYKKRD